MGKSFFNLLCPYIQFLFYSFFIIPCYDISCSSFIFSPISNCLFFNLTNWHQFGAGMVNPFLQEIDSPYMQD